MDDNELPRFVADQPVHGFSTVALLELVISASLPGASNSFLSPVCFWLGPLPIAHLPIFTLGDGRPGIIRPERQYPKQVVFMWTVSQQLDSREKVFGDRMYFASIQRERQPCPDRLQVGFLACPQGEERAV